jgi:hypothetical protein
MDHSKLNRILNKVAKSQLSERPDFAPIPYGLDENGNCYARGTCCINSMCGYYKCIDEEEYLGRREDGLDDDACYKLQIEKHRKMQRLCESVYGGSKLPPKQNPCSCSNSFVSFYTAQETCENIVSDDERGFDVGAAGCEKRLDGRKPYFDVSILPKMCSDSDKIRRKYACEMASHYNLGRQCDCENESLEDCALRLKDRCMQTIVHEQDKGMREKLICDCEREYLEALNMYYRHLITYSISDIPECSICKQLDDGYRQEYRRYTDELNALNVRCTTIIDDNPEEDDSDDPSGPRPPTGPSSPTGPTQPTRYP